MGNLPSRAIGAPTPPTTLDSYVAELGGDITYQASCVPSSPCRPRPPERDDDSQIRAHTPTSTPFASIGHSRFLKTIKASHPNGPLVVKVFVKADPGLSLLVHRRRLKGALRARVRAVMRKKRLEATRVCAVALS